MFHLFLLYRSHPPLRLKDEGRAVPARCDARGRLSALRGGAGAGRAAQAGADEGRRAILRQRLPGEPW